MDTYDIASGAFSIQYDPELFEFVELTPGDFLNGRIVDVNSELPGSVYVSFVGTEQSYSTDLVKVKFRTKKNVTSTSQIKLVAKDFYDADLNSLICNGCTSNIAISFDDTYTEDAPGMILHSAYDAQSKKVIVTVKLEKDSCLGAGDFVLKFDPAVFKYSSYTKGFEPSAFYVNTKLVSEGTLKFSIISTAGITQEQTVLQVALEPKYSCNEKTSEFQISGSGLTDSMTNTIMLNFIGCSQSIAAKHTGGAWINTDPSRHWQVCSSCQQKINEGAHVYDNDADMQCNICGASKYTPGDLNGDEGVTQDDAIYLLKHTFRPNSYPIDQPVDYNGDGSVNQDDAIYLLKHTFRPNAYPLANASNAGK